jgi:hypothetical protein
VRELVRVRSKKLDRGTPLAVTPEVVHPLSELPVRKVSHQVHHKRAAQDDPVASLRVSPDALIRTGWYASPDYPQRSRSRLASRGSLVFG